MQVALEALSCRRGGRTVFQDITFRADPGTAALVRGPNGVGKSSLLRLVAGLIPPASGQIRLAETPADAQRLQETVAYLGHLDAIKPALGVAQNLAFWAGVLGSPSDDGRVAAALQAFGLDQIANRPVAQCSAGQRRRLGLARLLVVDRPVWLLDEPTVSLDSESTDLLTGLIRDHCAGGGTALIATHVDLDLPAAPVLQMRPPETGQRAITDAFLDGDWR